MSLRILRKGVTVTELNISPEIAAKVEEIKRTVFAPKRKSGLLKTLLGCSLCSLCNGVPSIEVSHDLGGGFKKIEMFCDACAQQLWARDDPEDKDLLAQKYHCINGQLPKMEEF